jgi:peroxiredoxin
MQCRSHAAQLGQLYSEFQAHNCEIILILGASLDKAKRYAKNLHLPYPVLADPERTVYHRYGLEKALLFIQRTASVIIESNGRIRYLKTTTSPMVWLDESRELLGIIQNMQPAA